MLRRPSLRSQLNQIRLWVRQGRTDAWIAHKLDIPVDQLEDFKRDHGLDGEPSREPEPSPEPVPAPEAEEDIAVEIPEPEREPEDEPSEDREAPEPKRRRRRGRRGGRGRGPRRVDTYEATFEHGGEGYGLWLDPAVVDSEVYSEHWAEHRAVVVTIEPDAITIRRVEHEQEDDG